MKTDPGKACRTPAILLGERGSAVYYRFLVLCPFVLVGVYLLAGLTVAPAGFAPLTVLLVLVALLPALKLARADRERDPTMFSMLDARTAQVQLMFGLLLPAAFALTRL